MAHTDLADEIIDSLNFCVIDLETTGGNHSRDKIIEIGMVKMQGTEVFAEKSFLINPNMPIPDFIQKLTGISQNDVADAPVIKDVIHEVIDFIDTDIIVAHNTSFDVPFLNSTLKRLGFEPLENRVICTNVMTKHLIPEILNSNLNYMSRLFKINHTNAHRASDDALATAKLLSTYLEIFKMKGLKKVNQLYYPRNKFELDRIHFSQDTPVTEISELIKKQSSSLLVTAKGERGIILAAIPIEDPSTEYKFAEKILNKVDWKMVTLRLINPYLETLFQFCNHYQKHSEEIREEIKNYLSERFRVDEVKVKIEKLDFLMGHHIISDQVMVYSFLNLNNNTKAIFKIPAQKKKLYQHLMAQINRFENNQKGKRKVQIPEELTALMESYLTANLVKEDLLYLDRKDIKKEREHTLKTIEVFVDNFNNLSEFPTKHL